MTLKEKVYRIVNLEDRINNLLERIRDLNYERVLELTVLDDWELKIKELKEKKEKINKIKKEIEELRKEKEYLINSIRDELFKLDIEVAILEVGNKTIKISALQEKVSITEKKPQGQAVWSLPYFI